MVVAFGLRDQRSGSTSMDGEAEVTEGMREARGWKLLLDLRVGMVAVKVTRDLKG